METFREEKRYTSKDYRLLICFVPSDPIVAVRVTPYSVCGGRFADSTPPRSIRRYMKHAADCAALQGLKFQLLSTLFMRRSLRSQLTSGPCAFRSVALMRNGAPHVSIGRKDF